MSEWKPISTAPKDGTAVLVFGDDGMDIASWDKEWGSGAWCRMATAEYTNDMVEVEGPSHWMPLPPPPSRNDEARR